MVLDNKLRNLLRINAAFSTLTGAIALVAASPVADFLGVQQVWLIRLLGVALLGFAAAVLLTSRAQGRALDVGSQIISLNDFGWVLGTLVVLALGWLTTEGAVVMGLIGLLVLSLGIGQTVARRQMLVAA